ncbi:MAG: response regulator transcription factor [Candidatus Sericytochromatia bacterium]|nr:response regulator transcription factor [Candidatus Tanganyikabacteria bacterium]
MPPSPVAWPVLLADDDRAFRALVAGHLRGRGYQAVEAEDGGAALAHALLRPFGAIVTDLRMPALDGLELVSKLEAVQPEAIFIFVSGSAEISEAIEALKRRRVVDFLLKPLRTFDGLDAALDGARAANPALAALPDADPDPAPFVSEAGSLVGRTLRYLSVSFADRAWLEGVCAHVGYSPNYLTGVVKQATGHSLQRWVTTYRLAAGRHLLRATDLPVGRIAEEAGFSDARAFMRTFREACGRTPSEWRSQRE